MQTVEYRLNEQRIFIAADMDALSLFAVKRLIRSAHEAIIAHGAFYLALSGGSTPVYLHQMLARPDNQQQLDWRKVHIFFGDERNVPADHPDSNYRMARETLLTKVPIPASQIHAMPTRCDNMQDCADRYAETLASMPQREGMPCFDYIVLGMGNDGHTASLFPHTAILDECDRSVAAVFVPKLNTWRISLTYPVLNQANAVMVLASGSGKADVLYDVFNEPTRDFPIQRIQNARLEWYVDTAAAARLIESDVGLSG